jgi:hypothetical protein
MLGPLGIDRIRASEISDTYESDTYFALQMNTLGWWYDVRPW